jgi:DNA-binding beta-propeller fold protein YncE
MSRAFAPLFTLTFFLACSNGSNEPPPSAQPDASIVPFEPSPMRGMAQYRNLRCANCHGADGRGGNTFPGGPLIVGRRAEDLRIAIVRPCEDPGALRNCHPLKIPDLSEEIMLDLEAYLLDLVRAGTISDPGPKCTDTAGHICTLAGSGIAGNRPGDRVSAREAYLFWPQNVIVDPQGRVVITDWNNYLIRRIEKEDCVDGDCPMVNIIGTGVLGDDCSKPAAPISAKAGLINHPVGVHYDHRGHLIMWGWHQWKVKYIPVDAQGELGQMLCLWGNGPGFAGDGMMAGTDHRLAKFDLPGSAYEDVDGSWYIADQGNLRIRRIIPDADDNYTDPFQMTASLQNNIVETWAGGLLDDAGQMRRTLGDYSDSGDGGPVSLATFNVQTGFEALPQMRLALDRERRLMYVADSDNNRIRVIDLSQNPPTIDTFAGGGTDYIGDGVDARMLQLVGPADVDIIPDGSGDILIADTNNNCIRVIERTTRISRTVAGMCGETGYGWAGDGGPALSAKLAGPGGAWMTADRTLYIADTLNHRVRRVNR